MVNRSGVLASSRKRSPGDFLPPGFQSAQSAGVRFRLSSDPAVVSRVREGLRANGGHCPCMVEKSDDSICPCFDMRTYGRCICGLFVSDPPPPAPGE